MVIKRRIINSSAPVWVLILDAPTYDDHWVTAYGYYMATSSTIAYVIVNDGWGILIQSDGDEKHNISFPGFFLCIDGVWYLIGSNKVDDIRNLYNDLEYEEISVFTEE